MQRKQQQQQRHLPFIFPLRARVRTYIPEKMNRALKSNWLPSFFIIVNQNFLDKSRELAVVLSKVYGVYPEEEEDGHGIEYAYLVKSVWDKSKRIATQRIIKYLGKSFDVTLDDIRLEYRNSVCDYIPRSIMV
jgi:hypothetical protein